MRQVGEVQTELHPDGFVQAKLGDIRLIRQAQGLTLATALGQSCDHGVHQIAWDQARQQEIEDQGDHERGQKPHRLAEQVALEGLGVHRAGLVTFTVAAVATCRLLDQAVGCSLNRLRTPDPDCMGGPFGLSDVGNPVQTA